MAESTEEGRVFFASNKGLTVNEDYRELDRRGVGNARDSLVERLDPALGEASSGIGVLLSELVRRTLRGGVAKIEEEMHDFVGEKVALAVEHRMPAFQEAATRTAEVKARDIARQEVEAVERASREAAERLAGEIADTERRVEDKARAFTREAVGVVEQETKAAAEKLTADLAETERRAEIRARELMAEHVEELKQKSKSTYLQVRESLDELVARAAALDAKMTQEQQARDAALREMRSALDGIFQQHLRQLHDEVTQLRSQNAQLETRLAELEKPRGLFGKWFGRKKKSPPADDAPPREGAADA